MNFLEILFKNSRTYLSSTSVPLEVDAVSVHDDTHTDTWVRISYLRIHTNGLHVLARGFPIKNLDQYRLR